MTNLKRIVDKINRAVKDPGALMLSNETGEHTGVKEFSSTGFKSLDSAIGTGGLPVGFLTTIIGDPSAGKTTLCYKMLGHVIKEGGFGVLIDEEGSFQPDWARTLGLDPISENLAFSQPGTVEFAFTILENLVRELPGDRHTLIVWDSLSASSTYEELGETDESGIPQKRKKDTYVPAGHAKLVSREFRRLLGSLRKKRMTLVIVAQPKDNIMVQYGLKETYIAEKPLRFNSHLQFKVSKASKTDDEGHQIKVYISKNKMARPFTSCLLDLSFDEGLGEEEALIDILIDSGVVNRKGGWYYIGEYKAQGMKGLKELIETHPELVEGIV